MSGPHPLYYLCSMQTTVVNPLLAQRYNQPVPRYTSYPTVPNWQPAIEAETWQQQVLTGFQKENANNGIALYLHLPFCESLCTYCGCNKKITTNHSVELQYVAALRKEWGLYRQLFGQKPVLRELHLGGGTPTFFSPQHLREIIDNITGQCELHPEFAFSIEGHPNNTTGAHLATLASLGFKRISYGVQDNDPEVQRIINRIQPVENVRRATVQAREYGFTSVNYDLIYGLPLQTLASIRRTIEEVIGLGPDRIAFYSYAHVPWTSKAQRLFDESHLPTPADKLQLYLKGRELLVKAGYVDIGMDHFALPTDELYKAWKAGQLHRNFMGYTTQHTNFLLGLGVSAISDAGTAYAQNEKTLHDYYARLQAGELPLTKGFVLDSTDRAIRQYILDISCRGATTIAAKHWPMLQATALSQWQALEADGLITLSADDRRIQLTPLGHSFIRNVCATFDQYLHTGQARYSKAI